MNDLAEGVYALTIVANDLGQNETRTIIPFTIDRTPPVVKLDSPAANEYFGGMGGVDGNTSRAVVTANGSIVEKYLKSFSLRYGVEAVPMQWNELVTGSSLTAYPSSFTWSVGKNDGVPDGQYTLSLYAEDKAGQTGEVKVKLTVDNTLPTAAITSHLAGDYVKQPVEVKGTAVDTNFDKYTLEFSEGPCASAFKWAEIKAGTAQIQDAVLGKWQALPEDGNYCLRLKVTDKLGQTGDARVNVKVDTHPPAAPLLSGQGENKTTAHLTWTGNTEPDLAGFNIYRDGKKINSGLVAGPEFLDANLVEGVYTYSVKAQDFAGWESPASNEAKVKVDLTGPDASIRSPKDGARVGNLIDIKGTAYSSDDFKQYRVSVGQGTEPSAWQMLRTSPVPVPYGVLVQWDTTSLVENEVYSIKLEAEDIAGNITTQRIGVVIDNTPPKAPELIPVSALVSDATITWKPNTETDLAGYLLFRNDQLVNVPGVAVGNLKPYLLSAATTTYLDRSLPDGTFQYYVLAMDQAGNVSDQSVTQTVTIDTHAPHATIMDPADQAKIGQKFMVRAECPDLDVASVRFQYQGIASSPSTTSDWLTLGPPVTSSTMMTNVDPSVAGLGLAYGDYRLRVIAKDKAGNEDWTAEFVTITYADLTPPAMPESLSALVTGGTVTLTWSANTDPDLNGYNLYRTAGNSKTLVNSGLIPANANPVYQDSGLEDAVYLYELTAVDASGNESRSAAVTARIYTPVITQNYTPVAESSIQVLGTNAGALASVTLLSDTAAGLVSVGTTTADQAGIFELPVALSTGENRLTARATDSSGNVSKDAGIVVVVLNDTPAAPAVLSASVIGHDVHVTWNPNAEQDLLGYNVYRDGVKQNKSDALSFAQASFASSSSFDPWQYPQEMAADSDPASYWMPQDGTSTANPAWWEADLSAPELISRIEVHWGTDVDTAGKQVLYAGKDYDVQVWSGYAWITQVSVKGNTVKDNVFDFRPSYRTDRIRILITDSTDVNSAKQVRLTEVSANKDNLVSFATSSMPGYDDPNLANKTYSYTVSAVDSYGFESALSETADAVVNVQPPSAPVLNAASALSDITLNWTAGQGVDIAAYMVYRAAGQNWVRYLARRPAARQFPLSMPGC